MALTTCKKCGYVFNDEFADKCPECMTAVNDEPLMVTCVDCGDEFDAANNDCCPTCGCPTEKSLPQDEEPAPVEVAAAPAPVEVAAAPAPVETCSCAECGYVYDATLANWAECGMPRGSKPKPAPASAPAPTPAPAPAPQALGQVVGQIVTCPSCGNHLMITISIQEYKQLLQNQR